MGAKSKCSPSVFRIEPRSLSKDEATSSLGSSTRGAPTAVTSGVSLSRGSLLGTSWQLAFLREAPPGCEYGSPDVPKPELVFSLDAVTWPDHPPTTWSVLTPPCNTVLPLTPNGGAQAGDGVVADRGPLYLPGQREVHRVSRPSPSAVRTSCDLRSVQKNGEGYWLLCAGWKSCHRCFKG